MFACLSTAWICEDRAWCDGPQSRVHARRGNFGGSPRGRERKNRKSKKGKRSKRSGPSTPEMEKREVKFYHPWQSRKVRRRKGKEQKRLRQASPTSCFLTGGRRAPESKPDGRPTSGRHPAIAASRDTSALSRRFAGKIALEQNQPKQRHHPASPEITHDHRIRPPLTHQLIRRIAINWVTTGQRLISSSLNSHDVVEGGTPGSASCGHSSCAVSFGRATFLRLYRAAPLRSPGKIYKATPTAVGSEKKSTHANRIARLESTELTMDFFPELQNPRPEWSCCHLRDSP